MLYILITFLVRQVRCPQLVEGTFPLSYYSFDTLIKLLLLLLLSLLLLLLFRFLVAEATKKGSRYCCYQRAIF